MVAAAAARKKEVRRSRALRAGHGGYLLFSPFSAGREEGFG
jgi:hypothetical protein